MLKHPETELLHVYLDVALGDGYHYFVNSSNTGPWERALIEELIPELERAFPIVSSPNARFLTGHSSGGWSALWLQIKHPDYFGGVWSVSPDPVDFSDFFGIDLSPDSRDNFYRDPNGIDRKVARSGKLRKLSLADYVTKAEEDQDSFCDSDFGSYECAFSPKLSRIKEECAILKNK
jgi:esterase/lipase superfamily enzyme